MTVGTAIFYSVLTISITILSIVAVGIAVMCFIAWCIGKDL